MKREFKVGDEVTIIGESRLGGLNWLGDMNNYLNKTFIIEEIQENVRLKGTPYWWDKNWLKIKEESMWDDKTVEAIKKSVEHWEENVKELEKGTATLSLSTGSESCSLCKLAGFYSVEDVEKCHKCPLGIRGFLCINEESPYKIFMGKKTIENARNMVLALKSLFYPEEEKKEVFYHVGQRFDHGNHEHILARTNNSACLIGLTDGNRWMEPIGVSNCNEITEKEFKQICGTGTFTLKESK